MSTLLLLQFALPLALIAWAEWRPLHSRIGVAVQFASSALYLVALGIVGLWTLLPWWTPWSFSVLLLLTLTRSLRAAARQWLPSSGEWAAVGALALLGCTSAFLTGIGLQARIAPPDAARIGFPLEPGNYLVVNGGNHSLINAHLRTLDDTVPRFRKWRAQSYGVDIVGISTAGFRARGLRPANPVSYAIHGARVIAPCSGTAKAVVDGLPDNVVPQVDREHMAGNYVILSCSGFEIVIGHLLADSIRIAPGAAVELGDYLAAVGNSGNSNEPHLHIHAQTPGTAAEPLSGNPLHVLIAARYPVRNQRLKDNSVSDRGRNTR